MTSFLEKAKQAQKKEVKKETKEELNPFGETWNKEYINTGSCMRCGRTDVYVSKYNGSCLICDNIMTEKTWEKYIKKFSKKEEKLENTVKIVLEAHDEMMSIVPKKILNDIFGERKSSKKEVKEKHVKIEETIEQEEYKFSYSEHPIISLVWGYEGTSKSEQIMKFEPKEKTLIFDLEDKLRPIAEKLRFPQKNIINAKKYNEKFDISGPKTLQGIRGIINEIKECKLENKGRFKDIEAVAFDGISDIRKPYAVAEWLKEHPERQKPMNWGDWGEINDKVKDICFSMINMGLVTNTNIFFTAQIDWKDDKEIPDCKPWIWFNIQHKFKMTRDDVNYRFYAFCEKSYHDPFFTIDLTDWTHKEKISIFNIVQDPKLVKEYIEKSKKEQDELTQKKLSGDVFGN